jgi:hypothetical protein
MALVATKASAENRQLVLQTATAFALLAIVFGIGEIVAELRKRKDVE